MGIQKLDEATIDNETVMIEEIQQVETCRSKLQVAIIDLQAALGMTDIEVSMDPSRSPSPPASSMGSTAGRHVSAHAGSKVKLPKLSLNKFTGDPTQCMSL